MGRPADRPAQGATCLCLLRAVIKAHAALPSFYVFAEHRTWVPMLVEQVLYCCSLSPAPGWSSNGHRWMNGKSGPSMFVHEDQGGEGGSRKHSPWSLSPRTYSSHKERQDSLHLADVNITHCSVALENSNEAWGTLSPAVPYPLCRRHTHSGQFEEHGATVVINLDSQLDRI